MSSGDAITRDYPCNVTMKVIYDRTPKKQPESQGTNAHAREELAIIKTDSGAYYLRCMKNRNLLEKKQFVHLHSNPIILSGSTVRWLLILPTNLTELTRL